MSRALAILSFIGERIPLRAGQKIGRAVGTLAWHVLRRERRRALKQIALALPEWTEERRRSTIRGMFQHFGITLFEIIWLRKGDAATRSRMTRMEGGEPLRAILASGRSVMVVSGHCGNWEWSAHEVATLGPMAAWQRERDDPGMNRFMIELREVSGIRSIGRGSTSSAKELLRALRQGVMLTVLMDQNIRADSVKVPFFGRPALTPIGLAKLAVSTQTPMVPVFQERLADGTHHIHIAEPIEVTRDTDPVELTARVTAAIEDYVRRFPEQWVWVHDRWRERPKWDVSASFAKTPINETSPLENL